MGKLAALFIPFVIVFYLGAYFFVEYLPTDTQRQTIVVLRVTQDDKPYRGTVRIYDSEGYYSEESGNLACYYIAYEPGATSIEILDGERAVFSTNTRGLKDNDRLNINLDTGAVTREFSFGEYATGLIPSMGILFFIQRIVAYALAVYFFLVLTPLGFLAMVYSIIRETASGIRRRFAGSYPKLALGLLLAGAVVATLFFAPEETRAEFTQELFGSEVSGPAKLLTVFFLVGYPLYLLACRTFNAEEVRAQRTREFYRGLADANTFTYTEYHWSDGTTTSDYAQKFIGQNLGFMLFNILTGLVLPISTYYDMIKYYLAPILDGEQSWKIQPAPMEAGAPPRQ